MARKRKTRSVSRVEGDPVIDTFPDSEDDFYAGKDRILLDEGPATKRRRKLERDIQSLQPSDEEVFEHDDAASDEEEGDLEDESMDDADATDPNPEDDDGYWGSSKADYFDADVIKNQEDAVAEEIEARRLQQKQFKRMTDADFGFDEVDWKGEEENTKERNRVVEKLPPVQIPESATDEEQLAILHARYPEFEPLSQDLILVHGVHQELVKQIRNSATVKTKKRAATAYVAAIAMYLAILTSTKDGFLLSPLELRDHPVMGSLFRCHQLWDEVKDLEEQPEIQVNDEAQVADDVVPKNNGPEKRPVEQKSKEKAQLMGNPTQKHISPEDSSSDDLGIDLPPIDLGKKKKDKTKSKKPRHADLSELISKAASVPISDQASEFGDEAPLNHEETAEKARKKKSLRFYTSQIAQKANKRGAASREAGGDDDVPYKERTKDKQARLAREAENKARHQPDRDDFGDAGDDSYAQEMKNDANDYYNEIVSRSTQKKVDKRARVEAYAEGTRQGAQIFGEEQIGPDGKRKITYAIAKNKGLTPKRKKEVRNPRVKKKKKYEEKMKKLGSIRPIYKGGEDKGGYGGELTGIKTNVVKSVKL